MAAPRVPALVAAAAVSDDAATVLAWVDAQSGDAAAAARTTFQSGLLHLAAATGAATTLAALLARPAFRTRACLDSLDYGSMRRTALHLACQSAGVDGDGRPLERRAGCVACVEALLAAGADPDMQGKSFSSLVAGLRCGSLVDVRAPPAESPAALAACAAVKLALARPPWTRKLHALWPPQFRDAVAELLRVNGRRGGPALDRGPLDAIISLAAYPVSAWV